MLLRKVFLETSANRNVSKLGCGCHILPREGRVLRGTGVVHIQISPNFMLKNPVKTDHIFKVVKFRTFY